MLFEVFSIVDQDGSGVIDQSELAELMRLIGLHVTDQEFDQIMLELDEDGSGEIDFEEFNTYMQRRVQMPGGAEAMLDAFRTLARENDPDGHGGLISDRNVAKCDSLAVSPKATRSSNNFKVTIS